MPENGNGAQTKRKEFRFELEPDLTRYVLRMRAQLGMRSKDFFAMCVHHFRHAYPARGDLFLLVDEHHNTYMVVEIQDNGFPSVVETDSFTCRAASLLDTLRGRYPDLIFGRTQHVLRKPGS